MITRINLKSVKGHEGPAACYAADQYKSAHDAHRPHCPPTEGFIFILIFYKAEALFFILFENTISKLTKFAVTTVYATLGDEAVLYAINECQAATIFVSAVNLPKVVKINKKLKLVD